MLNTKEISDMLNVSEETVRRWIRTGELQAVRDGKSYLVEQEVLEEFIKKKSEIPGTSLSKMQNLFNLGSAIITPIAGALASKSPNIAGRDIAAAIISTGLGKMKKESENKNDEELTDEELTKEDIEEYIQSLERQRRKLELEHEMKLLELDETISKFKRVLKLKGGEE